MEYIQQNRCIKYQLPDGQYLDILSYVFDEIGRWIQYQKDNFESGGYIVGYESKETKNITLEKVSHPYNSDIQSRFRFTIQDPRHSIFLMKEKLQNSYYMGVWHTHPEDDPTPSAIDWNDWKNSMETEISGSDYIFFIIAGKNKIRIWAGIRKSGEIVELSECKKYDELYLKD